MISVAGCRGALFRARAGSPRTLVWPGRALCSVFSSPSARCFALQPPPDVPLLADAARISLSPNEVEEFAPKIKQVVDWFGQLQAVDLENIEPSLRADTEVTADPREDSPKTFENREAILAVVPSYDDPYIRVPKVLNKE